MNADRNGSGPMPTSAVEQPSECSNMHEIRGEIDRIDRLIVGLLGERLGYVHEAAKFKTSETSVRALDRVASMLGDREQWAAEAGIAPSVVRELHQHLIDYFTEHELQEWSQRS